MKHILFTVLFLLLYIVKLSAQNFELNIRFNAIEDRYEVYALPDLTNSNFFWGPSQITVVVPESVVDNPFNPVTSVTAGQWADNTQVYAPAADPTSDFHSFSSFGAGGINITTDQETLIFYFSLSGNTCVEDFRLFINGTDPDSGASGMNGGDFNNSIYGVGGEAYIGNYNNSGTTCDSDNDGLTDGEESLGADGIASTGDETDPNTFDTDGDGLDDGEEVLGIDNVSTTTEATGISDPNNSCDPPQAAGYANYDSTNAVWSGEDCDSDGVSNGTEVTDGTDPYNSQSFLPVELKLFSAAVKYNYVEVHWETMSETNNSHFILLHSADGLHFDELTQVQGSGTTNLEKHYQFIHYTPVRGNNYYQLIQVDFDGKSDLSQIVVAEITSVMDVQYFPNPVQEGLTIIWAEELHNSTIEMRNATGQLLYSTQMEHTLNIPMEHLPKGIYLLNSRKEGKIIWTGKVAK